MCYQYINRCQLDNETFNIYGPRAPPVKNVQVNVAAAAIHNYGTKTNAERMREYRARKKLKLMQGNSDYYIPQLQKLPRKSDAQRMREYRARKKLMSSPPSMSKPASKVTQSTTHKEMESLQVWNHHISLL